jgi:hypothetical protein
VDKVARANFLSSSVSPPILIPPIASYSLIILSSIQYSLDTDSMIK